MMLLYLRPKSRKLRFQMIADKILRNDFELCVLGPLTGQYGRAKAEVAGGAGRRRLRPQVTKSRGLNNLSFSSRFLLTSSELRDNSFGTIRPHPPKMARNWPVNGRNCAFLCSLVRRILGWVLDKRSPTY
jgi:hypothetical protein